MRVDMARSSNLFIRILSVFAILLLLIPSFTGCNANKAKEPRTKTYFGLFDTVSTITSYADESAETFEKNCDEIYSLLSKYNNLFDIYYEYSGINNLCTVNKNAGISPVEVDNELIAFLEYSIDICKKCDLELNIAMGSVLTLWHDARLTAKESAENAYIPSKSDLENAARHTDIDSIVIDKENGTVYISDPCTSIDVGAIGKGYAVMKAADLMEKRGLYGYLINAGGNVRTIGEKTEGVGWVTGITNPDIHSSEPFCAKIVISNTSCVTSGNYERTFTYDGKTYHHIIDRDTNMPSDYFSSVSIVCYDSALADALSTALFCMSEEKGRILLSQFEEVEALWVYSDGKKTMTDGFTKLVIE